MPLTVWVFILISAYTFCQTSNAARPLAPKIAQEAVIRDDLRKILIEAKLPENSIQMVRSEHEENSKNTAKILCNSEDNLTLEISAQDTEWSSTFYLGLQKLGFLFPHPRLQISPTLQELHSHCGTYFDWNPALKNRGFHFHTQHPNEWVHGFLMDQPKIAEDTIRWLARNMQNTFSLSLLKDPGDHWKTQLSQQFHFANQFGIYAGVGMSFISQQQHSYRLLREGFLTQFFSPLIDPEGKWQIQAIQRGIQELSQAVHFDFAFIELGTSEFTSGDYEKTLQWIEAANNATLALDKQLFIKIHVSVNQHKQPYGNYNFLPQYSTTSLGALVHTVMYYSLLDLDAPVYGRKDFSDIRTFMENSLQNRPTWYFPETSFFVGMDIDIPLFLTDFLVSRSVDMNYLEEKGLDSQLCFTTGQELGYWLFDWTVALLSNRDYHNNPLIGLHLLGEDLGVWDQILKYQTRFIKNRGLLAIISASTLLDENPFFPHFVHDRVTLAKLKDQPQLIREQTQLLEAAFTNFPDTRSVKNHELRIMLEVTKLKIQHSLLLRQTLAHPAELRLSAPELLEAQELRTKATSMLADLRSTSERYPEAHLFEEQTNPTSYEFGYAWTAFNLHYWEREERMISEDNYSPLFMNIFNPMRILF